MSAELEKLRQAIEEIWTESESTGLDPFPIHFEIVPATVMYEIGAYGIPGRFAHWTHGKAFHQMKTMYDYGLSKIYELIINTNPAQAFLMEGNSLIQNKLVIAHVIGHSDFFKKNVYFQHTNRQMAETAGVSAERIRSYEQEHGERAVEEFLDAVLSIQEHIDPNLRIVRVPDADPNARPERRRRRGTEYDDLWLLRGEQQEPVAPVRGKNPPEPEKDLLLFLLRNSEELEDWQRDVLNIVRNEMIYFLPQMQTKIMNEGWASYWHSRILREMDLTAEEHVEFTRLHAGVLSPSPRGTSINPYYVGFKIFEDIERRWNGDLTAEERRDYERENHGPWPHQGKGREKMFEVRELENDVSFLRNYVTRYLVEELDMYIYRREGDEWVVVEKDWRKIRDSIVDSMTNFGFPYLVVEDGDYRKARELYLRHCPDGRELDQHYAFKTLRYLFQLWGRPVHIETVSNDQPVIWTFDGEQEREEEKLAA
jgi:stage V sporulation protein R